jgi:hypothetical protein
MSGTVSLTARRYAVAAEAHVDFPLRFGALRLAAGPLMPLWTTDVSGVPRPHGTVVVAAGAFVRILYRIDFGRVYLAGGVAAEVALVHDDLTVSGVGSVAHTPLVTLSPVLAIGCNL